MTNSKPGLRSPNAVAARRAARDAVAHGAKARRFNARFSELNEADQTDKKAELVDQAKEIAAIGADARRARHHEKSKLLKTKHLNVPRPSWVKGS